eukprot:10224214-Ditylum_brightwellii.AAC.1
MGSEVEAHPSEGAEEEAAWQPATSITTPTGETLTEGGPSEDSSEEETGERADDDGETSVESEGDEATDTEDGVETEETEERAESVREDGADLLGFELTAADWKLMAVYGDTIHRNDGTHLDGGIAEDP